MRIRTVKPRVWHDPGIRSVSRDARLLFVALITLADDEGRFLALPSVIHGHAYPNDPDALRRIPRWMAELEQAELVRLYDDYGCLPSWHSHQRISHPVPSTIPEPLPNNSGKAPE